MRWSTALWDLGIGVDVVGIDAEPAAYDLLVLPTLYTVGDRDAARVAAAAEAGTHVVVSFFSGIVDEHDHVRPGGYPGAFRELLGVRSEEFHPLQEGEAWHLQGEPVDGTPVELWAEQTALRGAEAVATWADGGLAGGPAITRRAVGEGSAWYVAARPAADGTAYLLVLNHTAREVEVPVTGRELLSDAEVAGTLRRARTAPPRLVSPASSSPHGQPSVAGRGVTSPRTCSSRKARKVSYQTCALPRPWTQWPSSGKYRYRWRVRPCASRGVAEKVSRSYQRWCPWAIGTR